MVFEKRLLLEAGGAVFESLGTCRHRRALHLSRGRNTLHVAGDEFQLRFRVARPGLVDDADPGADIQLARVGADAVFVGHVVVGPPRDAAGLV
ncbi:hypothetical protein D3C83_35170 [compost metagenome]